MKRYLVIIFIIGIYVTVIKGQTVPNGSFEEWENNNGYITPKGWDTDDEMFEVQTVFKEQPGYNSNTAVKLTVFEIFDETIGSSLYINFSVDTKYDLLSGYFKNINPNGDTLTITVMAMSDDNYIGGNSYDLYGQVNEFTRFDIKLDYFYDNFIPDAITIMFNFSGEKLSTETKYIIDELNLSISNSVQNRLSTLFEIGQIYPQPATDIVNVPVEALFEFKSNLCIYDIRGNKVKEINNISVKKGNSVIDIPINDINSGLYFIRFDIPNGRSYCRKFLVN